MEAVMADSVSLSPNLISCIGCQETRQNGGHITYANGYRVILIDNWNDAQMKELLERIDSI